MVKMLLYVWVYGAVVMLEVVLLLVGVVASGLLVTVMTLVVQNGGRANDGGGANGVGGDGGDGGSAAILFSSTRHRVWLEIVTSRLSLVVMMLL
jgi:hypothetical protein